MTKIIVKLKSVMSIVLLILILLTVTLAPVQARDIGDIQKEIEANQAKLKGLQQDLASKQNELNSAANQQKNSQNELERVKAEITQIDINVQLLELTVREMQIQIESQELEKEKQEERQFQQASSLYMSWKNNDEVSRLLLAQGDPLKTNYYMEIVTESDQEGLNTTYEKLKQLEQDLADMNTKLEELSKQKEEKAERKAFLEEQIEKSKQIVAQAISSVNGIRAKVGQTQTVQGALNEEKQQMEQEISPNTPGGQQPLISGQMYMDGSALNTTNGAYIPSHDALGHGLGLSQFGAYGAAVAGWNAGRIVTSYYKDTEVKKVPGKTINVQGYGNMSVENYVAGLGEVPDYACGTIAQIEQWKQNADSKGWPANDPKRNKYVIDNPNTIWDCWPEEAIKAQVLAARSFGVTSPQPICTTAACQVYKGGKGKAWAAWETDSKYIVSKGDTDTNKIIRAFYSSYNNNGSGTADHRTIWPTSNAGGGDDYSYLKSVNDNGYTYKPYNRVDWQTNSYSMTELNIMLDWCVKFCDTRDWFKSSVKDKVGTLESLQATEDPSGRVKIVTFKGTKGSATVSGQYFRTLFNKWINSPNKGVNRPSDNIKSITFVLKKAS